MRMDPGLVTAGGKPQGRIITLDTVMRTPLPPIDWLVEGVLANGDRAVVYGVRGAQVVVAA